MRQKWHASSLDELRGDLETLDQERQTLLMEREGLMRQYRAMAEDRDEEIAMLQESIRSSKVTYALELERLKTLVDEKATRMVEMGLERDEFEYSVRQAVALATAGVTMMRARVSLWELSRSTKAAAIANARLPLSPPNTATTATSPLITLNAGEVEPGMIHRSHTRRTPRQRREKAVNYSEVKRTYSGHQDWVIKVALNLEEGRLVTASQDETSRVFDIETGECLHTLKGHTGAVTGVKISLDGLKIWTTSLDGSVRQWNMETGELLHTVQCNKATQGILSLSLVVMPQFRDGFVIGSRDDTASYWRLDEEREGKLVTRFTGHTRWVTCTCVLNGEVFTGSTDTTLKRWDLLSGAELMTYHGHEQEVTSVVTHQDYLYSGGREGSVTKHDISTASIIMWFSGHLSVVRDIALREGASTP